MCKSFSGCHTSVCSSRQIPKCLWSVGQSREDWCHNKKKFLHHWRQRSDGRWWIPLVCRQSWWCHYILRVCMFAVCSKKLMAWQNGRVPIWRMWWSKASFPLQVPNWAVWSRERTDRAPSSSWVSCCQQSRSDPRRGRMDVRTKAAISFSSSVHVSMAKANLR